MFIFVRERVFDHRIAHAAVLARWGVCPVGIVNVVFHRLRELALVPGGCGDGIDDIAAFLVHDDAARPHCEFRITHICPSLSFRSAGIPIPAYSLRLSLSSLRFSVAWDCLARTPGPRGN